jgi:hypothetical protein
VHQRQQCCAYCSNLRSAHRHHHTASTTMLSHTCGTVSVRLRASNSSRVDVLAPPASVDEAALVGARYLHVPADDDTYRHRERLHTSRIDRSRRAATRQAPSCARTRDSQSPAAALAERHRQQTCSDRRTCNKLTSISCTSNGATIQIAKSNKRSSNNRCTLSRHNTRAHTFHAYTTQ